jgi:dTDP-glucose 4,6-dehydratase
MSSHEDSPVPSRFGEASPLFLVYGARGWIGGQLTRVLRDASIPYIEGTARADDRRAVEDEIRRHTPTNVVSLIGRTHGTIGDVEHPTIDYLEQPGKLYENVRDNLFAPLVLATVCSRLNVHFTYLGTGCIFTYDSDHPMGGGEGDAGHATPPVGFTEDSAPNFFGSGYSCVKGFTDRLMDLHRDTALNLRIRMPISDAPHPRNFITKITTYDRVCSIANSMTVLPDLLPIAVDLMRRRATGTLNLTNPGVITHDEILTMFTELVDPSFTWRTFTIEEQRRVLASERSNNRLDTTKLESLYPRVPRIHASVRAMLGAYRRAYVAKPARSVELPSGPSIKCLLVTGGAGFIGSNFINFFAAQHPDTLIVNYDALYYSGDVCNVDAAVRASPNYRFVEGNLRSFDLLRHVFQTHPFTHIVHFAAQSHVQTSFTDALTYTHDNIVGTHNLLEAARLHCPTLAALVHISTDEVYGESSLGDVDPKTETAVFCPTNPYAATKAAAESLVQSYYRSFKLPIIVTRGNNVYGPNQFDEKVIPRFIRQLKSDQKITIQGDGSCVRSFLHASDAARAISIVLSKGVVGEVYNIGCDKDMECSIRELGRTLVKMIKKTDDVAEWVEYIEDRPFNDKRYYISNQKLKDLGWDIKVDLQTGLQWLVDVA